MRNQNKRYKQLRLDLRDEGVWEKLSDAARADCIATLVPLIEKIWLETQKEQDDE